MKHRLSHSQILKRLLIYLWLFDKVDQLSCYGDMGRYKKWPSIHQNGTNYISLSLYDIFNVLFSAGLIEFIQETSLYQLTFRGMKYAYLVYCELIVPRCWVLKDGRLEVTFKKVDKLSE